MRVRHGKDDDVVPPLHHRNLTFQEYLDKHGARLYDPSKEGQILALMFEELKEGASPETGVKWCFSKSIVASIWLMFMSAMAMYGFRDSHKTPHGSFYVKEIRPVCSWCVTMDVSPCLSKIDSKNCPGSSGVAGADEILGTRDLPGDACVGFSDGLWAPRAGEWRPIFWFTWVGDSLDIPVPPDMSALSKVSGILRVSAVGYSKMHRI